MNARAIWITGAGGLIGSWLVKTTPRFLQATTLRALTRAQVDLSDFAAVAREFARQPPQLVVHCAALSRSPECEQQPSLARKLNVDLTALLAELSAAIPFIFFSSDLVFDGRQGNYDEAAPVNPLSVYGETKAVAEQIVLRNPRHTVVRTSLNSGVSPSGDRGLEEQLQRSWAAGRLTRLFVDEFRCPIPAEVTARAIWELVAQSATGLYHLAGSERLSRWQIGQLVAGRCPHLNPQLEPASLKDYQGAPRPADSSLNCAKVQSLLSFQLPRWSEWLASHAAAQHAGEPA